jgi:hypothetical protein
MTLDRINAVLSNPNLLTAAGLAKAQNLVSLTAPDSPCLAEFKADAEKAQARWEAEAQIRADADTLRRAYSLTRKERYVRGFASRYWIAKVDGLWIQDPTAEQLSR